MMIQRSTESTRIKGICVALLFVVSGSVLCLADEVQLIPGVTKKLNVEGDITKVIVSKDGIADARPSVDGKALVVTALGVGTAEIRVERLHGEDVVYPIRVVADLQELVEELRMLLSEVEGLTIGVIGNRIVLDGELMMKSDYDRVQKVIGLYGSMILNLTNLDRKEFNPFVAKAIAKEIGIPSVNVRVSGETATFEGTVQSKADLNRIEAVARLRVPKVLNLVRVEEMMIETDVMFIQIDTSKSKDSGYNVLQTLGIDSVAEHSSSRGEGPAYSYEVGAGLNARINALVGEGDAEIIIQQHLSTKSGGSARVQAGGEEYIAIEGDRGGVLESISHGIILQVKPTMHGPDHILNDVVVEISEPNADPTGTFSVSKFNTSSTILCKIGESIVLTGLSQSRVLESREGTPFLRKVPIIKYLFSFNKKRRSNQELVVLITPKPVVAEQYEQGSFGDEQKELIDLSVKNRTNSTL